MRIIGGIAKRRTITVPSKIARPSTDRMREALYSVIQQRIADSKVLDLFAGSGSLGLEALSRGAQSCDFVDQDKGSAQTIRKNLESIKFKTGYVFQQEVKVYLDRSRKQYDLVFADPPYYQQGKTDFVKELLELKSLVSCCNKSSLLIVETSKEYEFPDSQNWKIIDQRQYGGCQISIMELST